MTHIAFSRQCLSPFQQRSALSSTVVCQQRSVPGIYIYYGVTQDYFLRASDNLTDQVDHSQELLQSDKAEVSHMAQEVDRFKTKGVEAPRADWMMRARPRTLAMCCSSRVVSSHFVSFVSALNVIKCLFCVEWAVALVPS